MNFFNLFLILWILKYFLSTNFGMPLKLMPNKSYDTNICPSQYFPEAIPITGIDNVKVSLDKCRENAQYLVHGLSSLSDHLRIQSFPENRLHSFHMFPIILKKPNVAPELAKYLEINNIETRPNYRLLDQPIVQKRIGKLQQQFPISYKLGNNGIFIGCHDGISQSDLDYIIMILKNFFKEN